MGAREITAALRMGHWRGHYGTACCPAHEDCRPSLSIKDGHDGRILLRCHTGCDFLAVLDALRSRGLMPDRGVRPLPVKTIREVDQKQEEDARRHAPWAKRLWDETIPLQGTPAEAYLRSRGISAALPRTLRFHPACWHPKGQRLPAMVGLVEGVERLAVHRTYLRPNGSGKAGVQPSKAMLGSVAGGAVRLVEAQAGAAAALVVAEGIETALSLASGLVQQPATVWAALSASGMMNLHLPLQPSSLIIATDGDKAGRDAGHQLATRAYHLGWSVNLLPAPEGQDWNDVLMQKEASA